MLVTCGAPVIYPSNNSSNISCKLSGLMMTLEALTPPSSKNFVKDEMTLSTMVVRSTFLSSGSGTFQSFCAAQVFSNSDKNLRCAEYLVKKKQQGE
jgi:hypothetical protein